MPAAGVRHISHRRFLATFPLAAVTRAEQDLYRCVSQAPRGAGVSNFAELIVKGQRGLPGGPEGRLEDGVGPWWAELDRAWQRRGRASTLAGGELNP